MNPEQEPTKADLFGPSPEKQGEGTIRRIPLSVDHTAVGYAIAHLDQNALPARVELIQASGIKAFEILIEEPLLRSFFDLQKIELEINGNTVATIRDMLNAAITCARAQGLVFPTEERESEKNSLCRIAVADSDHTVSYISSHIPLSIEEWTYGHKRHQVTAERRDGEGKLVAELRTKSLEYPDGSMTLEVTIVSHLEEHGGQAPHIFTSCARGRTSLSALTIELESLHVDILELPITDFLQPYFINNRHGSAKTNLSVINTSSVANHTKAPYSKPESFPIQGELILSQGSKISWNIKQGMGTLSISPQARNPASEIIYTQIRPLRDYNRFKNMVASIAAEDLPRLPKILQELSSDKFSLATIHNYGLSACAPLTEFLLEEMADARISIISSEKSLVLGNSEKTLALLEGREWIGFEIGSGSSKTSIFKKTLPHQIYFRTWQGACDKIILSSGSATVSEISIEPRQGELFSGSIPEMRRALKDIIQCFADNPFKLVERYHTANCDISPVYQIALSRIYLNQLLFFSSLYIENELPNSRLFTSHQKAQPETLMQSLKDLNQVTLSVEDDILFPFHLHFISDRLERITIGRRVGFWESFIRNKDERIFFSRRLPESSHLTPQEVLRLGRLLRDLIESHRYYEGKSLPTADLIANFEKTIDTFCKSLQKKPPVISEVSFPDTSVAEQ